MEDHYSGHEQSRQVSEVGGGLEDDGVGELDAAGGAGREEEGVVQGGEGCGGAEEEAEREGGGGAEWGEVTEGHDGGG